MVLQTVDLPAHNVDRLDGVGTELLADRDTNTYMSLFWSSNPYELRAGCGGTALGFGIWDQPVGSTVTDIRFAVIARTPAITAPVNDDWGYASNPVNAPFLAFSAFGVSLDPIISTLTDSNEWVELVSDTSLLYTQYAGWIIGSGLDPSLATFGTCPEMRISDWNKSPVTNVRPNSTIDVAYWAIRITYDMPEEIQDAFDFSRCRFT